LTHFLGKSETDITQALICSQFEETNRRIAFLSNAVNQEFDNVRRDLADNSLDVVVAPLQAINFAYKEMIQAFNEANSTAVKRISLVSHLSRFLRASIQTHNSIRYILRI
jgi:hypothetical protein